MQRVRAGSLLVWGGVTLGMAWTSGAQATSLWNGGTSNDWFTTSNWIYDGIVPQAGTTASIQTASGNTPVIAFGNTGVADLLVVGSGGANGLLTIGGTLNSASGWLGNDPGDAATTGTVNVSGTWTNSSDLYVGKYSIGVLGIGGGTVSGANVYVGSEASGNGTITLTGNGSALTTSGVLFVGQAGSGTLTANAGTTVTSAGAELGSIAGASGTVNVNGGTWNNASGNLTVGAAGTGLLTIQNGGNVSSVNGVVGASASSSGSQVTVTGSGSTWTNTGTVIVGAYGNGSVLDILAGGNVSSATGVIARYAGASGTVNVNGSGSAWTLSGDLRVAGDRTDASNPGGNGTLNIGNGAGSGGTVSNVNAYIGDSAGSVGSVTVNGGTWTNTGNLGVGYYGKGTLLIENGGTVSSAEGNIGWQASSTNSSATVTGTGSTWTNSLDLDVGGSGTGTLTISAGGAVNNRNGTIGHYSGSSGTVTVTGTDSRWTNSNELVVGWSSTGTLTISAGGTVSNTNGFLGARDGGNGTVTVTGAGSTWNNSKQLILGYVDSSGSSTGVLTIENGGTVINADGRIGLSAGSTGTVTVTGANSTLIDQGDNLRIGVYGTGTLNIGTGAGSGGSVSNDNAYIGHWAGSVGNVTVNGGTWTNSGNLGVGYYGKGTLLIENGGAVSSTAGLIGWQASSTDSSATVTGAGSSWTLSNSLYVGNSGKGVMTVSAGGRVSSQNGYVGTSYVGGQTSSMTVTGSGSSWQVTGDIVAGYDTNASGSISIADGATVTAGGQGMLGHTAGSSGTATVDHASWSVGGDFNVGWHGTGNLTIQNGGSLNSNRSYIGNESDGSGTALVTGTGSSWTTTGNLYVGAGGNGTMTVADAATVTASSIRIAYYDGTTGTLNVGAAEGDAAVAAGTLNTASISFGAGLGNGESSTGTLVYNHTDSGLAVDSVISGAGTVKVLGGRTIFTAANTYSGGTVIGSSATLQVGNGGTSGSIAGNISDSGTLAFDRSDDLAFAGDISGSGALNKLGSGTLTLNGAVGNTGLTTVRAGTLALGGSFSGGAITVNSGSTLALADGLTATLNGNYNQAPGSTLRLGASSTSSYGKLVTSGTANIAGNLYVDVAGSNHLAAGNSLASVIHASAINGTFDTVLDNSAIFDFSAIYTGTDVNLRIASSGNVYRSVAATGNEPATGAARALDGIFGADSTGNLATTFLRITGGDQAVSNAVSQTLPLLIGSSQKVSSAALTSISRVVQARLETNRGLSSGESFYGDNKFWMKPFGGWVDQDDRGGVAGYTAKTSGLAFGADATVSERTRLGLSLAYANADVQGNSSVAPNSSTINLYQLIGYGSYSLDADTELSFQTGIGQNKNSGQREIAFAASTARMKYDSLTATAGLGLGRTYRVSEQTSLLPSVRADYTWIRDAAYNETGAGALNLNVQKRTADELILAVDGKVLHEVEKGLVLSANLGAGYDALNGQASITAAYAGAPGVSFTTKGMNPSPWLFRFGLGVAKTTVNGIEIAARYDAEQRTDFLNQTASVKLRWAF